MPKITPKQETTGRVTIPESEYSFSFARSGGHGGQNVNKVETKAILRWNVWRSGVLSQEQKEMITLYSPLANRMDKDGNVIIYEQSSRSQTQNREILVEKFNRLVNEAITPQAERIETAPPVSVKEGVLKTKKIQSAKKEGRAKVKDGDY